ncbi:branched-chain amino acid aminotransferase [Propioniferax innocua]|uniref:Branched-chain-amino-acid aminotransferase n=1 Tax=Propioniferax innocua TaxID=1753 RepID=A0A542Z7E9_9ACTN|nr:branched-chain amino acid aminotransferase [Propioniferax innocua]TQL56267.1 branched-chain amino acid aminotransferase [Propioniferax innocua]
MKFDDKGLAERCADAEREAILADPGFGLHFTDHMAHARWTPDKGWHDDAIVPHAPLTLSPASAVLHYAQEVFEGLKAYRRADGSVWLFRPEKNGERFQRSAQRLGLPELDVDDFIASIEALIRADAAWVPTPHDGGEESLYIRPFMFASEPFLGVRAAHEVDYYVIGSPAGAYFASGVAPVSIWITKTYSRAGAGGTGAAKCGGNYASSLIAQQEAAENGCSQVLFADAGSKQHAEELGGMNVFFLDADDRLVTPPLSDSILHGVTRSSVLQVAADLGMETVERPIVLDEVLQEIRDGRIREAFACGTAAVITPIGVFKSDAGEFHVGDDAGERTLQLRNHLLDIQYGRAEDTHGWTRQVC